MANTYKQIASVSGTGSSATLQFSSIPATFTDLNLKLSLSGTSTGEFFELRFNGVSTNLSGLYIQGNGLSTVNSSTYQPWGGVNSTGQTANTFAFSDVYIPNYAGSTQKTLTIRTNRENNAATANQMLIAGLWANTSAITSIEIFLPTGNFTALSTATLYGIKNS
jgi:hypothetical protein